MTTCQELLKEAQSLAGSLRGNPVRRRTVIGRAYYAAYHALAEKALELGYRYPRGGAKPPGRHEHLIAWSAGVSDADVREAADLLDDMKSLRRAADYDLRSDPDISDANEMIEKSKHIVCELLLRELEEHTA
jgi:uncharacterized protein (UPF0332 family)